MTSNLLQEWDGFTLEREIGRGAVGRVFLAVSTITQRRFGVKVCDFSTVQQKRSVTQELILWIDLPQHSNVAPCHFFRTTENRMAIFTDFYERGSLERWLQERRLTRVPELLRLGAMTARALAFLHEAGFVHRDVKPRNVLMTAGGVPHISDLGLAAAQADLNGLDPASLRFRAATQAYRSPEQAKGLALGPATDVWSWGVTMLHALIGEATWIDGLVAGRVLSRYLQGRTRRLLDAPPELIAVIEQSLTAGAAARPTMHEVADQMERACQLHGVDLPAAVVSSSVRPASPFSVGAPTDTKSWAAPAYWDALLRVRGAGALFQPVYSVIGSRTARMLADLAAYDEVEPTMRLMASTDDSLTGHWASFLDQKSALHEALGDYGAALGLLDRSIARGEAFVKSGDPHGPGLLLAVLVRKALLLDHIAGPLEASAAYEAASRAVESVSEPLGRAGFFRSYALYLSRTGKRIQSVECLQKAEAELLALRRQDWSVTTELSKGLWTRGEVARQWGEKEESVKYLGRAISLLEPFVPNAEPFSPEAHNGAAVDKRPAAIDRRSLIGGLATLRVRRAEVLVTIGRTDEAIDELKRATATLEELVEAGETQHLAMLFGAYGTLGMAFLDSARLPDSEKLFMEVTSRMEDLVQRGGRQDLDQTLGEMYANYATAFQRQRRFPEAEPLLTRALALFEARFKRAPDRDIAYDLARALVNRGGHLTQERDFRAALPYFDRALKIYAEYGGAGEKSDLEADIAWAYVSRGMTLFFLQRIEESLEDLHRGMPVIQREAERTRRIDLIAWIDYIRRVFGDRTWGHTDD